jgi:hypothetical protein
MGYQRPRWISPWEYCKLLPAYGVFTPCGPLAQSASAQDQLEAEALADPQRFANPDELSALLAATRYIAATGQIDVPGSKGKFTGVYQVDQVAPDALQAAADRLGYRQVFAEAVDATYTLVQVNAGGAILSSREAMTHSGEDDDGTTLGFQEVLPLSDGVAALQLRSGDTVLAEQKVSANPPQVKLLSPNGGETLGPGSKVAWEASDADGDLVTVSVLYSDDGGASWRLIAQGVSGSEWTLATLGGIPGSTNARMRVIANDGFLTAQDDSDAAFTVPDRGPLAVIVSPENGGLSEPGGLLVLEGLGTDAEDGPLAGAALAWSSDRAGALGTGEELAVEGLADGWHLITLTATDSAGHVATASAKVYVGRRGYLPLAAN